MNIPFLNLQANYVELKSELDQAYQRVMNSGWYILGSEVDSFEKEFAEFCQAKYCVGVGSGLDALSLSLKAVGVGEGDEVIVPANTFIATWLAVDYCGATPVPVEPEYGSGNINPLLIEQAITSKTKAIIPVHLYGQPAKMDEIFAIAEQYNLRVIEDAAQAHGALYRGRRVGALGNVGAFSFYPGKNLGAFGDGGAIVTDSIDIYESIKAMRNYGSNKKYIHHVKGVNSRLDELQAAFLRIKLKKLQAWNAQRKVIAEHYIKRFADTNVTPMALDESVESAWHLFVVKSSLRDELQTYLAGSGVETIIHYPESPHRQGAYSELALSDNAFPVSLALQKQVLSLPMGPHLSMEEAEMVANLVCSF